MTGRLTVSVNVSQLIVHVEEAPEALLRRGHRPVTGEDVLVELQMRRGLCKVQEPRSLVKPHHDFLQPASQRPHIYITTSSSNLTSY